MKRSVMNDKERRLFLIEHSAVVDRLASTVASLHAAGVDVRSLSFDVRLAAQSIADALRDDLKAAL